MVSNVKPADMVYRDLVNTRHGEEIFLFSVVTRPVVDLTCPLILWAQRVFSLLVEWQGRDPDCLLPSGTNVKNAPPPPPRIHGMALN
jgi:hypothetical protein